MRANNHFREGARGLIDTTKSVNKLPKPDSTPQDQIQRSYMGSNLAVSLKPRDQIPAVALRPWNPNFANEYLDFLGECNIRNGFSP
jgi:hypothetical protein